MAKKRSKRVKEHDQRKVHLVAVRQAVRDCEGKVIKGEADLKESKEALYELYRKQRQALHAIGQPP